MVDFVVGINEIIRLHPIVFTNILVFIGIVLGAIIGRVWNMSELSTAPKFGLIPFLRFVSAVILTYAFYDILRRFSFISIVINKIGNLGFSIGLGIIAENLTNYIMTKEAQQQFIKWLVRSLSRHIDRLPNEDSSKKDSEGGMDND